MRIFDFIKAKNALQGKKRPFFNGRTFLLFALCFSRLMLPRTVESETFLFSRDDS